MTAILNKIIPYLKYWKIAGIGLLVLAFLLSFHFAKSRGEKLDIALQTIEEEREKFQTQLKAIEKARQDDIERYNFRKLQAKKFKMADDDSLRAAYDSLRARQARNGIR